MPRHSSHILALARKGADARFRELLDEIKMLTGTFPHLRDSFDSDELPVKFLLRRWPRQSRGEGYSPQEAEAVSGGTESDWRCPAEAMGEAEGSYEEVKFSIPKTDPATGRTSGFSGA